MLQGYLLLLLLPLLAQATSLSVQQHEENNQLLFSYHFRGLEQDYRFRFALDQASIRRNSNLLQVFVPEVINQRLCRELQQQVRQAGPYRVMPGAGRDWQNFQLVRAQVITSPQAEQAESERQQLLRQLQQFSREYQQQQLRGSGYQLLHLPDNRQLIVVDHPKIIQQSLVDIAPVAQSVASQFKAGNQRQFVSILLNWIQLIPAHPAEQAEFGRSFTPPLQLLHEHQGDSASKTALLAALLRSSLPTVKQAILYLPEYTLLALAIPAKSGELTVQLHGTTYLVMDPAGLPHLLLGQVTDQQKIYVFNQYFAYRLL